MGEIKQFKNQDYALLKSQHNSSNLFVDPEFPPNIKSLTYSGKPPAENVEWKNVQWKRPKVSRKIGNYNSFAHH